MVRAVHQRLELRPGPDVERADPFRRVELVPRDRQEIGSKVIDAGRNLSDRLCRIGVERHAVLPGNGRACLDGHDGSDLVVGVHHADEDRVRGDRATQIVGVDAAGAVHREHGDPRALAGEELARRDDGRMLHRGGDDVRGLDFVHAGEEHALQREVVRFASPAREHDLRRLASEQLRDLRSRVLHVHAGRRTGPVKAGRVPVRVFHDLAYLRRHGRCKRGAGVVVEVDARGG